jgi:GAF domain-containing protein/ActR/RegA family two-component response regulator
VQKVKRELQARVRETTTELKVVNQQLELELEARRQMEAEIRVRARQQAAIAELGQRALAGTSLSILMDEAVTLVAQTLELEYAKILELTPSGEMFLLRAGVGWQEGLVGQATVGMHANSQAGYTVLSNGPVIVEDLATETRFKPSWLLFSHEVVSGMSVIIQGRNRTVGVLGVYTTWRRTFTEDDAHFLQAMANVLAMAIERKETETQLLQSSRETEALRQAGAALSSTLDYEEVLDRILEQVGQVVPHDAADLMLIEDDTARIFRWRGYNWGETDLASSFSFKISDSPTFRTMKETGRPLVIPDVEQYDAWVYRAETAWIKSYAATPILIRGQVIGFLNVDGASPGFFSQADAEYLEVFANQAAIAIENAHLFKQSEVALEDMSTLYRVARLLPQLENEQDMFEFVLAEYLQRLNLQQGGVLIFDDDKTYGILKALIVAGQLVEPGLRIPVAENPSYKQLIATQHPVVIYDVLHDKLVEPVRELTVALGIKSLLLVPIVVRGEVIGALGADATESMYQFMDREISLVEAVASQLAIALENTRLYAKMQRHADQLTSLHELDQAISTSLRLIDIYYAFARHASSLLHYDHMGIALLAGEEIEITYVAGQDKKDETLWPVGSKLPRKSSVLGWVIERGQPLLRHSITVDNHFEEDERLAANGLHSVMIIPLRIKGQTIGTWSLTMQRVGAYSPDDLKIAQAMADQLAIAIENARLYDEIRLRAAELTTLNEISQAIISTLDLQEMLTIITDRTIQLLGVAATAVALYDETRRDLWFAAAFGLGSNFVRGKRLVLGQGVVGWVVQHGEAVLIPDVWQDARFLGDFDRESGFTTRSILCVPLQTKGQTIGAIEAMNKAHRPFDQQDLQLLSSLAAPAAAAIENAWLYERAQQEIAERKRAEAALAEERTLLAQRVAEHTADLRVANLELARASRLKDEFLASMSHELRTPLTAILGMSEILKMEVYGPLSERQHKSVSSIEESGRHLLALINDILDLSKIEAGKVELQIGSVSIEEVCEASLQFIKQTALQKKLKVHSTYDKTVTTVPADERRLKQILVNLLSNAVKFTPEGGEVGLEVKGNVAHQVIYLSVWDTGIGISQEDMPRLFQPFVQLDSSLSRHYAGTGLGLVLVKRMVTMHGGEVAVESAGIPGQGSRFTISLPWPHIPEVAAEIEPTDKPVEMHGPFLPDGEAAVVGTDSAPVILLAEDEDSIVSLLTDYLQSLGYRIAIAGNGFEALEQARQERPDLILMDVQMPGLDGLEATRRLRADANLSNVPVVMLTALAMSGDRERCLAVGATEYLSKPIDLMELGQLIGRQLCQDQGKKGS